MGAGIATSIFIAVGVLIAILGLIFVKGDTIRQLIIGFAISIIGICITVWILGAASSLCANAGSYGSVFAPSSRGPAAASSQDYNPSTGCEPYTTPAVA